MHSGPESMFFEIFSNGKYCLISALEEGFSFEVYPKGLLILLEFFIVLFFH